MDALTLHELRTFLAVVEEGSFSAAARRLRRVQSAVSQSMANLETQLGLRLWDRATKVPTLTEEGRVLVGYARRVTSEVEALADVAASLAGGNEPFVSLCVDSLFPLPTLVSACGAFAQRYPEVDLRVSTETMSAVTTRVLSGDATLGLVSPMGLSQGLERRALFSVRLVPCVAEKHPLARVKGKISQARLAEHVQIVLSERSETGVPDQGVLSARTWRVGDLHTKHALMLAGLGWGNLPEYLAKNDLRSGRLVRITAAAWSKGEHTLHMSAVFRPGRSFGPAHKWLLSTLEASGTQAP